MNLDSFHLMEAVFESSSDGIVISDLHGHLVLYNRAFQEMWHIPDDVMKTKLIEVIEKHIWDELLGPEEFSAKLHLLYSEKVAATSEDMIQFKDGRYLIRTSKPLRANGEILGRICVYRDISKLKKSEELFKAITDLSPDIISILSPDGTVVFNSAAADKIHGYSHDEIIGRNTFELIHPDDRDVCQKALVDLLANPGSVITVQYRYLNKNGTYTWMEATANNQIENHLIKGLVSISRDISKRKRMEQDLNEALKLKDDFISIVAHELRTPVTSIKLQLQMIQRAGKAIHGEEAAPRSENLPAMIDQVNALDRLIEDLLQVSRVRNNKLVYEMFEEDISLLLREQIERFGDLLTNAGCEVETDIEDHVHVICDRRRIEQVLGNLISNVLKYAPGKPVRFTLKKDKKDAMISLRDHGVGIPVEKQKELFKLFGRVTQSRTIGGLGVGLYLSKNIIDQHGGTIEVKSEEGKGAEFILRIPAV